MLYVFINKNTGIKSAHAFFCLLLHKNELRALIYCRLELGTENHEFCTDGTIKTSKLYHCSGLKASDFCK